jgi:AraC-like DNA-binding protein
METIVCLMQFVRELLPNERPTIERIAPRLGMSVRTLQRRLSDWGRTFEQVLDETLREVAMEQLATGSDSITNTALQLGYSDVAHFTRAFRRWTGMTPSEFAKAAQRSKSHHAPPGSDEASQE